MRFVPYHYNNTLWSVKDNQTDKVILFANSEGHAEQLASECEIYGGRPPITIPDTSWVDDSEMGQAILARPTRKTEKVRGIQI
jgi:hypothetical protein